MKSPLLLAALLFSFLCLSVQAETEEEANNYLKQTVIADFTVENMPAGDALAAVQKAATLNKYGIYFNIAAKDKIKKGTITMSLQNASAYDVIAMICSICKVKFVIKKDQILIFEPSGNAGL